MLAEEEDEPRLTMPGNVTINTGAGDDSVKVSFVNIGNRLQIVTQTGNDIVDIGRGPGFGDHEETVAGLVLAAEEKMDEGGGPPVDVVVGGTLTINTSSGADEVKVGFADIGQRLCVNAGSGNDFFIMGRGPIRGEHGDEDLMNARPADESRPPDSFVGKDVTINMAGDDDLVLLRNTDVSGRLRIVAGLGNNQYGTQNVTVWGRSDFRSGDGDDTLAFLDSQFNDQVNIRTGAGHDSVYIATTAMYGQLSVILGADSDAFVSEQADLLGGSKVLAQGGDDSVQMLKSVCDGATTLNGGAGFDNIGVEDTDFMVAPTEVSFEEYAYDPTIVDFVVNLVESAFEGFLQGAV